MADYTAFFASHSFKKSSRVSCLIKEGPLIRYIINLKVANNFFNGNLYLSNVAIKNIIDKFEELSKSSEANTYRLCLNNEEMISCFNGYNSRNYKDILYDMRRTINAFASSKDFAIIDSREIDEMISLEFLDFIILKKSKISNRDILDGIWRVDQSSQSHSEDNLNSWQIIKDDDIMNQNLNTGV